MDDWIGLYTAIIYLMGVYSEIQVLSALTSRGQLWLIPQTCTAFSWSYQARHKAYVLTVSIFLC